MQKLFMALSFFFVFSYANNDISGFTESIFLAKGAEAASSSSFTIEQPKYEDTYATPHNPYTGKIQPIELKTVIPIVTEGANNQNGFDGLPSECYDSYQITIPGSSSSSSTSYSFIEYSSSSDHSDPYILSSSSSKTSPKTLPKLCYDKDNPKSAVPTIFISSKIGGKASFVVSNLSNKGVLQVYNSYHVEQIKKFTDVDLKKLEDRTRHVNSDPLSDGSSFTIDVKNIEDGGIYSVAANYEAYDPKEKKMVLQHNPIVNIKILPYKPEPKYFFYVQLDGKNGTIAPYWNPLLNDPNSFTKDNITEHFNKIYKQAVITPVIQPVISTIADDVINGANYLLDSLGPKTKKITNFKGIAEYVDRLIVVNMADPSDVVYHEIFKIAHEYMRAYKIVKKDDKDWQFIYAINKERKEWPLHNCVDNDDKSKIDLTFCHGFKPEEEATYTDYYVYSPDDCKEKTFSSPQPVTIRSMDKIEKDGTTRRHYYAFIDKTNAQIKSCDILFTENGYPVLPSKQGVISNTTAITIPIKDEGFKVDNYLAHQNIVISPRGIGDEAYFTLLHEIGHTFGLTDVSLSSVVNRPKDGFKNVPYPSPETNMMSWQRPNGKKIRYRNSPIVCTGGTHYEYPDGTQEEAIERETGGFENQWECIRNCFQDKFRNNKARQSFFNFTEACSKKLTKNIISSKEIYDNYIIDYNNYIKKILINND